MTLLERIHGGGGRLTRAGRLWNLTHRACRAVRFARRTLRHMRAASTRVAGTEPRFPTVIPCGPCRKLRELRRLHRRVRIAFRKLLWLRPLASGE